MLRLLAVLRAICYSLSAPGDWKPRVLLLCLDKIIGLTVQCFAFYILAVSSADTHALGLQAFHWQVQILLPEVSLDS